MITSMLSGNLGNHMFNYAIARTVAKYNGYSFGFDPVPKYDYYNGKEQMYFMNIDYGEFPTGKFNTYNEKRTYYNHDGDNTNIQIFDPDVFNVPDNTDLVGGCWQSEQYYNKNDLREWFSIKPSYISMYEESIKNRGIVLDENVCVINFRGGEYRNYGRLILNPTYYINAMNIMKSRYPDIKFIVVTDDVATCSQFIKDVPIYHFDIGMDYYLIYKAKKLILSNSSFCIIPTWLNQGLNYVLAPKYWARHNVSNGYWAVGDQYYEGWNYVDRDGTVNSYDICKKEALEWRIKNGL